MRHAKLSLLLAALIPLSVMAGQVFEWKDATGKKHYSDQPPPGVDAKPVGIKTTAPRPSPPAGGGGQNAQAPKTWAERNDELGKRQAEEREAQQEANQQANEEQRRAQVCASLKDQLQLLESGRRVQRMGENGEPVVLDDAARAEEINRTKADIERTCNE